MSHLKTALQTGAPSSWSSDNARPSPTYEL